MRGLLRLTWLETKIFLREPLGVIGSVGIPVAVFLLISRGVGSQSRVDVSRMPRFLSTDLPVLASLMIATSAVLSLVAIIAIYREGGILKRLRATPLRAHTILTAHVLVKLVFALATLAALLAAGKRVLPAQLDAPIGSFAVAVLFSTLSLLAIGFVLASVVPVARFAQPVGALGFYPMLALCGLFFPVDALPPTLRLVAKALPLTYAVSLMKGIWRGEGWIAHGTDVAALALTMAICIALSAKWFRWE